MKINRIISHILLFAATVLIGSATAQAGTNGFIVPTIRSSANSEYGYWEIFTNAVGAPGNLPDQPGATTDAVLTQNNPAAILLGGNIYNPSTNSAFTVEDATPFVLGTVVLQTRTLGLPLDYTSVTLTYSNIHGVHSLAPVFRYELSRAAGGVSSLWQWDLIGLNLTNYTIVFNGSAPHVSFDSMILDTAAPISTNFIDNVAFLEQPFAVRSRIANITRANYPFSSPTKTTANVFGALGNGTDFDSRDAQFLLGWNLTNSIPTGKGAENYVIRRVRVTLTIAATTPAGAYIYNDKLRDYRTYFPTNDPRYLAPPTTNIPVELFGVGFRGGFTNSENVFVAWASTNYPQTGPWSADPNFDPFAEDAIYYTNRVAFAAGFDTNGALVDVSNNVNDDGTNEIETAFEVAPFAVGQSTNVAPGETFSPHHQITFDLNLGDPLIYGYVQKGLHEGNLSFMVTSFKTGSQGGTPTYPVFFTIFNILAASHEFPLLDIEGEIVRANFDNDADGLSDDWENFYFGSLANGATTDADGDGVKNLAEYQAGTIPTANTNWLRSLSLEHNSGASELQFSRAPGRQYSIQWSGDLQNWQTVTNPPLFYSSAWLAKTGTNLVYPSPVFAVWFDTNATNQQRFYRVGAQ